MKKPAEDAGETQVLTGSSATMDFIPYFLPRPGSRSERGPRFSCLEKCLILLAMVLLLCVCVLAAVLAARGSSSHPVPNLQVIEIDTAQVVRESEESYPVLEENGLDVQIRKVKRNLTEQNYLINEMHALEMADSIARLNHDFARRYPRDSYARNNIKNLPRPLRQVSDGSEPLSSEQKVTEIMFTVDRDGSASADPWELYNWIVWVEGIVQRHILNEQWAALGRNSTFSFLSWGDYQAMVTPMGVQTELARRRQIRDRRRWEFADDDQDDLLSKFEFKYFIFPQLNPQSGVVLIPETHADLDTDFDGRVSLAEYLDVYEGKGDTAIVTNHFQNTLDTDRNRFLDVDELAPWVDPQGFIQAKSEVIYLMESLDSDRNKELTTSEALTNLELFLSSQVSCYGDIYKLENLRNEVFRYQRIS